jgi:hypothetical protein
MEREREREQRIGRVRDGVLDRNRSGVGWKWPLVKMDTQVFQIKQISRTNRMSIKRDKSWVGLEFFHSLVL